MLGSYQSDALQNITGSFNTRRGAGPANILSGNSGVFYLEPSAGYSAQPISMGVGENTQGQKLSLDVSRVARTSVETRGPNTALAPRIIAF